MGILGIKWICKKCWTGKRCSNATAFTRLLKKCNKNGFGIILDGKGIWATLSKWYLKTIYTLNGSWFLLNLIYLLLWVWEGRYFISLRATSLGDGTFWWMVWVFSYNELCLWMVEKVSAIIAYFGSSIKIVLKS